MLEQQKLVDKTKGFSVWGRWQFLPLVLALLSLFLCISLYLSLNWPQAERHQDQHLQRQQEVMDILHAMPDILKPNRAIDPDLVAFIQSQLATLTQFRASLSLPSNLNPVRDPMTFVGRLNLIINDLQILQSTLPLWTQLQLLQQEMKAARGALTAKRYPDGSAARGFQWVSLSWLKAQNNLPENGPWTWQAFDEGKALWQSMIGQMSAFSLDLTYSEEGARKNAAKDLRDFLNDRGLFERLRKTDALYTQVGLAKDRLLVSLGNLPPAPESPTPRIPLWQWLIFPAPLSQGLQWLLAVNAALVILCLAYFGSQRKGMSRLAEEWFTWVVRQEVKIRKTSPGLHGVKESIANLSDDLDQLADRFLWAAQAVATQTGDHHSESQVMGLQPLQAGLQQDVRDIREKLLNLHMQFCGGASQANLIYDMTDVVQRFEGVEQSLLTLAQQVDLIGHHQVDPDVVVLPVLSEQWRSEVLEFKRQLKTIRKELENVEGLIDHVADKVPPALRFEDMNGYHSSGRRIDAAS
jgi:hypothetical protein